MSEAHLGRYCGQSDLRYNTRTMTDGERAWSSPMASRASASHRRIDKLAA
jgi:hypothetical protein